MAKKKDNKTEYYYSDTQENAVIKFMDAETIEERNIIYNADLRKPISKMISSIIRTYKLYPENMEFRTIHDDVLTHLHLKFNKFDGDAGKKSFSYFSTIVKNYLLAKVKEDKISKNRNIKYQDISKSLEERPDMMYDIETTDIDYDNFFKELINDIESEINEYCKKRDKILVKDETSSKYENEINVGYAIIKVLEDWESIFENYEGHDNRKFNKNMILLCLRNLTGLSTKEIRNSMKKYKVVFEIMKMDYYDE